ncbi:MAG TPA: DUF11 domain-containing protein, partial [Candidatus Acetothermia bacterium]|nr:DUF11 domain-containing protein [Candidatus Acetothermia bacterium]
PPSIALSPTSAEIGCGTSSVRLTASASGGKPPYTYVWYRDGSPISQFGSSSTYDVTQPGSYVVEVRDANQCTATSNSARVTQASPPNVALSPTSGEIGCGTSSVRLTASVNGGKPPYTYAWYRDGSPLSQIGTSSTYDATQSGTYFVEVRDANQCAAASNNVRITQASCIEPKVIVDSPTTETVRWLDGNTCGLPIEIEYSWNGFQECSTSLHAVTIGGVRQEVTYQLTVCWPGSGKQVVSFSESLCHLPDGLYDVTVEMHSYDSTTGEPTVVSATQRLAVGLDRGRAQADLSVVKSSDREIASEGDEVTFTVELTNDGPSSATGIGVEDLLPQGLKYLSHQVTQGIYDPETGRWSGIDLPFGDGLFAALRITAAVNEGSSGQIITNAARICCLDQLDPDLSNNGSEAAVTIGDGLPPEDAETSRQEASGSTSFAAGDVVVSEIAWAGTAASAEHQWIELRNTTREEISLDGWMLLILYEEGDQRVERQVALQGVIAADAFFLLTHESRDVVQDIESDMVYEARMPDWGAGLILLSPSGDVIDEVNREMSPWPAGFRSGTVAVSMERISVEAPGQDPENWVSNNTIVRHGHDALGLPINGTPSQPNSAETDTES